MDAREVLLLSLDTKLREDLEQIIKPEHTFPVVFMYFITKIQIFTFDRIDNLREQLKSRDIKQYSGQSIDLLCSDYRSDAEELVKAGSYDNGLSRHMLQKFLKADGPDTYKHPLLDKFRELEDALMKTRFMSSREQV